jgi:hypothetical protein
MALSVYSRAGALQCATSKRHLCHFCRRADIPIKWQRLWIFTLLVVAATEQLSLAQLAQPRSAATPKAIFHLSAAATSMAPSRTVSDVTAHTDPILNYPVAFGISAPLRELAKLPQTSQPQMQTAVGGIHRISQPEVSQGLSVDPVEQSSPGAPSSYAIGHTVPGIRTSLFNFADLSIPYVDIAVGDTQVIQSAGPVYQIFDKHGAALSGTINATNLWGAGLPDTSCASASGDQLSVHWDGMAHRWLLTQNVLSSPNVVCLAISATPDALGSYYLYQFAAPDGESAEYTKWGIWSTGYFEANDVYSVNGLEFKGAQLCAYNSTKLIAGDPTAEQICLRLTSNDSSLLPADVDSPNPPPVGQDEFFMGGVGIVDTSHLSVYSFHADFANSSNSFVIGADNTALIPVPTYNLACNAQGFGVACASYGTAREPNFKSDRLSDRLVYWNDGAQQHWLCNHDALVPSGNVGIRWYELATSSRAVSVTELVLLQSGTFAPDLNSRWMGSLVRDQKGDMLLEYNQFHQASAGSGFVAGRISSDPPGMLENEIPAVADAGTVGSKIPNTSGVRLDPIDNCTFWYASLVPSAVRVDERLNQITSGQFLNCSASVNADASAKSNPDDLSRHTRQPTVTMYSNLGSGSNLYNCCTAWTFGGSGALGESFTTANEFQVTANGMVTEIDLAVNNQVTGSDTFYAALYMDSGGQPGTQLKIWHNLTSSQSFGGCCGLVAIMGISGLSLRPNTNYWMVLGPDLLTADTSWGWNYNNQGATGLDLYSNDGGLTWVNNGIQPTGAMQIIGTPTGLPSTTVVSSSQNPSNPHQPVTFTATVTGSGGIPTGTVTFTANHNPIPECPHPINLNNGSAPCTTTSLPVGSDLIQASYSGDGTYDPSSGTLTQIVRIPTTTTVNSSRNPSNVNDPVTFTATVDGSSAQCAADGSFPTGNVTFTDNGTIFCSASLVQQGVCVSKAACPPTAAFVAGTHAINTSYPGDGEFAPSTGVLSPPQQVNKGNSNTVLQSSINPSAVNQSVTFTTTVTATNPGPLSPTGTVTFTDNNNPIPECPNPVPLVNGAAACTTRSLPAGSDALKAAYSGDSNFNPSTGQLAQTVNQGGSNTALVSSQNPSMVNQPVTFTATVTAISPGPLSPTGTVTFTSNNAPIPECPNPIGLVNGVATCTTRSLPVGADQIKACYSGDGNFTASCGQLTQTVGLSNSMTTLQSSQNPSTVNNLVTFTATVSAVNPGQPTPTGIVTFTANGISIPECPNPVNLVNGVATCNTRSLAAGPDLIKASYSGDGNYGPSMAQLTQIINKGNSNTALRSSQNPSNLGSPVTLTATVTAVNPGPLAPTGTVTFTTSGNPIPECSTAVTLVGGTATCTTQSLPAGSDPINAVYSGDANFTGSMNQLIQVVNAGNSQTVLQSSKNPSNFNDLVTFTATVSPLNPERLMPTGTVTFTSNGNPISECPRPINLVGGVATCTTQSLPVGRDLIKASYSGDNNFSPSSAQITQTVNSALTVTCTLISLNAVDGQASNVYEATATCTDSHGEQLSTTMDWGDGSPPITVQSGHFDETHPFTGAGNLGNYTYHLTVTATDTSGQQGQGQATLNLRLLNLPPPLPTIFAGQTLQQNGVPIYGATNPILVFFTCTGLTVKDRNTNRVIDASTIGITCESSPQQITLEQDPQLVTLLIHTTGGATGTVIVGTQHQALLYTLWLTPWPVALLNAGCCGRRSRRGRKSRLVRMAALGGIVSLLLLLTSCGSGGFTPPPGPPAPSPTPAGCYDVTVRDEVVPGSATTGFVQNSPVIPLCVQPFQ